MVFLLSQVAQRVKDELEPLLEEIKEVEQMLEEELEIGDGDLTKILFVKKIGIYIEVWINWKRLVYVLRERKTTNILFCDWLATPQSFKYL